MATQPRDPRFYDDDPLLGDSLPSLSFKDAVVGTTYSGVITKRARLLQQRDFDTQQPATWEDGNPKMAVVIDLLIGDEKYALWAPKPSAMFAALIDAQKAAGAGTMVEGGVLHIKFTGTETNKRNPRLNAQKLYAAKYEPPAVVDPLETEAELQARLAEERQAQQPRPQTAQPPRQETPRPQPATSNVRF